MSRGIILESAPLFGQLARCQPEKSGEIGDGGIGNGAGSV